MLVRACSAARTRMRGSSDRHEQGRSVAGVRAVITYRDAPKVMVWGSRQSRLNDRARYKGEAVAALAAVDARRPRRR